MPRHFPKTLEPVIIRLRTNLVSADPLTALSPNTKTLATSGRPEEREKPILTSFLGTDEVGGCSRTYINVFLPFRERDSTKLPLLDGAGDHMVTAWRLTSSPLFVLLPLPRPVAHLA